MLVDPGHRQEIIGELRDDGFELHHFALLAEPATVVHRLYSRSLSLEPRAQPWEVDHLDAWLRQLRQPESPAATRRPPSWLRSRPVAWES